MIRNQRMSDARPSHRPIAILFVAFHPKLVKQKRVVLKGHVTDGEREAGRLGWPPHRDAEKLEFCHPNCVCAHANATLWLKIGRKPWIALKAMLSDLDRFPWDARQS
jgi:hypothetical protein